MKVIKKVMVTQVVVLILLVGLASVSHAVETDVDVGIEFTEIAGKPKPVEPPKEPPQQPIQKVIRLPQTSNKNNQKLTILGLVTLISMISLLFVRKNEVLKNEIK